MTSAQQPQATFSSNPKFPSPPQPFGLIRANCQQRQQRLRHHLGQRGLDGALFTDIRYVHYFTGHWHRGPTAVALFIPIDGPTVLVATRPPAPHIAVDTSLTYTPSFVSTMIDDQPAAALEAMLPAMEKARRLGCDQVLRPWLLAKHEIHDIADILVGLRRTKDPDEIALIRRAISGCQAAYAEARRILAPGITEVQVYARALAAVIEAVGEPVGDFGNDFQAGSAGGPPRPRAIEAGELMPLDLSVIFRVDIGAI